MIDISQESIVKVEIDETTPSKSSPGIDLFNYLGLLILIIILAAMSYYVLQISTKKKLVEV